jgi:hypothetical protein
MSDRERTAERLLRSSADKFYDPDVDIDWTAPLEDGKYYLPEHRVSLYGTALWDRLTPEQRLELGRQEIISITSFGILSEVALMHMLLHTVSEGDPTSRHAQYALTEVADECRHSTMFGRSIEKSGARPYLLPRKFRALQRLVVLLPTGPSSWGGTLLVEEMLDRLQRETMADDGMQTHIRMVNRIHVLEEARHITYAREELRRLMPRLGPVRRAFHRVALALAAFGVARVIIDPRVYKRVGLDPREARRAALANPHYRETIRWMGERLVGFLREAGMISGPLTTALWRRSFLLGGAA